MLSIPAVSPENIVIDVGYVRRETPMQIYVLQRTACRKRSEFKIRDISGYTYIFQTGIFECQNGMNDYSQILYNKRRLIPQNITDEFEKNFAFIQRAV